MVVAASIFFLLVDQFFAEVAPLPFDNDRAEFPAEILSQRFVCRAIVVLEPPRQTGRITYGSATSDNGVISDFLRHQNPSFLYSAISATRSGSGTHEETSR